MNLDVRLHHEEAMLDAVFPGQTEMARRMRALDWTQTILGPVDTWPQALRTSVSTCLECAFPIVLWWGPELIILYNDEYRAMLGPAKHPAALGQPGGTVWAEIWDVIQPMLSHVMSAAQPTRSRDLLLHIDRGYPEEAYFSFSYSPIHDEHGRVGGIFCPVIETTEKVIGERRLRTLRDLAAQCKGAETEARAYRAAAEVLGANPHDVPFALIYRVDPERSEALLEATAGIEPGAQAAPRHVPLVEAEAGPWSLGQVARSGEATIVTALATDFGALPTGAWKTAPHTALVLPMLLPGQEHPRAILVAALSPMRALDADHRTFFELVATQIASGLADAQALEEERRRAQALAEIDRAKTAFFSNVSHEFRTPLTLMMGPIEDEMRANPASRPRLALAHRNSLRLLKLVNTLLDFARLEAGRVDASYEPTDLAALTSELAGVFRSTIEKAGLRLVVECPALPAPVYVDHDMWEKVVLNLLSNAYKFTFEGEIRVALLPDGEYVELRVSDTGVGIADADLPRMFERFHRVRDARARTHEGTGIGLALVQELARLHGGEARVESRAGHGSTFMVRIRTGGAHLPAERITSARRLESTALGALPFVEEAGRWLPQAPDRVSGTDSGPFPPVVEVSAASPPSAPRDRARVYLVDDNADMRDYVSRLLAHSYAVESFADGQAALERVRASPPELVVTDVMMPRLDGFELLQALRADERTRALPVLLLSARAGEEAHIEGARAGADAYMIKPFSARELLARVSSLLELARVRREGELALQKRSAQFETLLDRAPLGVFLVDADFRVRQVNPIALAAFGDIPGGVVGRDFDELVHTMWERAYADESAGLFRHTLASGEPYVALERAERRIDRQRVEYYTWRVDRIMLPDGRYGAVCYFRDISDQVQAREAIEASREALYAASRRKDEFLATLSHELRTPLNAIVGWTHVLRDATSGTELHRKAVETIQRNAHAQNQLISDMLDVSSIIAGKMRLNVAPVDLALVIRAAADTVKHAADARAVRLELVLDPHAGPISGDAERMQQIVWNLLSNAIKYAPEKQGRVLVRLQAVNSHVRLTVEDNGPGIEPDFLPHVFDRFSQADSSNTRAHKGLGLGLAIVRHLVELHGGTVTAENRLERGGAILSIELPRLSVAVHGAPVAERHPSAEREQVVWLDAAPSLKGLRVLVVDDQHDARELLQTALERCGAKVSVCGSAAEALVTLRAERPDVLVADVEMPGQNGYELMRAVRALPAHEGGITPAAALTAYASTQDRMDALNAGFQIHVPKPVQPAELAAVVASLALARR